MEPPPSDSARLYALGGVANLISNRRGCKPRSGSRTAPKQLLNVSGQDALQRSGGERSVSFLRPRMHAWKDHGWGRRIAKWGSGRTGTHLRLNSWITCRMNRTDRGAGRPGPRPALVVYICSRACVQELPSLPVPSPDLPTPPASSRLLEVSGVAVRCPAGAHATFDGTNITKGAWGWPKTLWH